jgi:predicted Zn finger-like uncharacterized protein
MIIQCQSCSVKYFLPEEKVPASPLKVRCPKCRAVFVLAGRAERAASVAPSASVIRPAVATAPPLVEPLRPAPRPFVAPVQAAEASHSAPAAVAEPAPVEPMADPVVQAAAPIEHESEAVEHAATPAPEVTEAPASPAGQRSARGGKSADDRAKRLARVLVSDILWYNRERRDAALRDGTLMTSLGEEIKKSWELYKEKVGPEAAHSTNYFKEALNEILANGQQVF